MDKIRNFRGITAERLIEALKQVPGDTKICIDLLGDNFPIKQIEGCTYNDGNNGNNGKKGEEHKGILLR